MTPVAIKTAAKRAFPSITSSAASGRGRRRTCAPAASARAISPSPRSRWAEFGILKKIKAAIIDQGKSDLKDLKSFGSVYYNSGVIETIIAVEAIRTAQARFASAPSTARRRSGASNTSCSTSPPEGTRRGRPRPAAAPLDQGTTRAAAAGKVLQWDGAKWNIVSNGWVKSDRELPAGDLRAGRGLCPREGHHARSEDTAEAGAK